MVQRNQESLGALAKRDGSNPKTIARRHAGRFPTVLSIGETGNRCGVPPSYAAALNNCISSLLATIPHSMRFHRIAAFSAMRTQLARYESNNFRRPGFNPRPFGYFHIDITELEKEKNKVVAGKLLWRLLDIIPYKIRAACMSTTTSSIRSLTKTMSSIVCRE
ncbi:hypothetical protein GOB93_19880 [Acetobacter musti]|uniref:Uncharacterized protein n=1 Tax=Acetobacter musti TaxID=864732 RepID=A0ABX0JXV2_9PROT|nr:hypothetical protein [Acetobacter musti]NHN86840.1 hypothetical protein [Acetobacter musti]